LPRDSGELREKRGRPAKKTKGRGSSSKGAELITKLGGQGDQGKKRLHARKQRPEQEKHLESGLLGDLLVSKKKTKNLA